MKSIDKQAIVEEVVYGDLALLRELIAIFLHHCPDTLSAIEAAVANSDAEAIELAAHNLKNYVANFRAHRVLELAHALEVAARNDRIRCGEIWATLKPEMQLMQTELAQLAEEAACWPPPTTKSS
jgi:HPt (histidine-containing phosphotransfer) domain-containing protein